MRYLGLRSLTQFLNGHQPGPEAGIFKLYWSEYHKEVTELAVDILGPDAMAPSGRRPTIVVPDRLAGRAERQRQLGRHVVQRPGRHDLRRARARSSATSSARWCSASRRSREAATPSSWRDEQAARS